MQTKFILLLLMQKTFIS